MIDTNPWNTEWNNDAAEHEQAVARTACPTCGGMRYVADVYGEAEACPDCDEEETSDWQPSAETLAGIAAGDFPF